MSNKANRLAKLTIAVLAILGVYWIAIGVLQILVALASTLDGSNSLLYLYALAAWNIVISIFNLRLIRGVRGRYASTRTTLNSFAMIQAAWSMFFLATGAWLQLVPLLLAISLAVLVHLNKDYYTELSPREIEARAKEQVKGESVIGQ